MKKILTILLLVVAVNSFSQTKLVATLVRNSPTDTSYGILADTLLNGSLQVVLNKTNRNAIPYANRKSGMVVITSVDDSTFQLQGGITNSNWVNVTSQVAGNYKLNTDSTNTISGYTTLYQNSLKLNKSDTSAMLFPSYLRVNNPSNSVYFMGNSLTYSQVGGTINVMTNYLNGLLGKNYVTINRGLSGESTIEYLARFNADIIAPNDAKYVVIFSAVNDYRRSGIDAVNYWVDSIEARLQRMYTLAHNTGAKVVAVTDLPFKGYVDANPSESWSSQRQLMLDSVTTWITTTATNIDYIVNPYSQMSNGNDSLKTAYTDGSYLHCNTVGYDTLAAIIYRGVNWTSNARTIPYQVWVGNDVKLNQDVASYSTPIFRTLNVTDTAIAAKDSVTINMIVGNTTVIQDSLYGSSAQLGNSVLSLNGGLGINTTGANRILMRDGSQAHNKKVWELQNQGGSFRLNRLNDSLSIRSNVFQFDDNGDLSTNGTVTAGNLISNGAIFGHGNYYHSGTYFSLINKAQTGYNFFLTRDTSTNEARYNVDYINTLNTSGRVTLSGAYINNTEDAGLFVQNSVMTKANGAVYYSLKDTSQTTNKKEFELINSGANFYIDRINDTRSTRTHYFEVADSGKIYTPLLYQQGSSSDSIVVKNATTGQLKLVSQSSISGGGIQFSDTTYKISTKAWDYKVNDSMIAVNNARYSPIAGSSSITTVGTIGTGVWQGTSIKLPYIDTSESGISSRQWRQKGIDSITNLGYYKLPALTAGSVLFSNGSTIAQNNSKLFWDNTNNRLGIRTASPNSTLQIGTQTSTSSATPDIISLGGTYGNSVTNGYKLKLYDDGTLANDYAWGISSGQMNFKISNLTGNKWAFYGGAVLFASINQAASGGSISLLGSTSGTATITTAATAGTPTLTLPTSTGTFALTSDITTALASYLPLAAGSGSPLTGNLYFFQASGSTIASETVGGTAYAPLTAYASSYAFNAGAATFASSVTVQSTTASSSYTTGALVVSGGGGFNGNIFANGDIHSNAAVFSTLSVQGYTYTSSQTITTGYLIVYGAGGSAGQTLTLPAASGINQQLFFKNISSNAVTISKAGSDVLYALGTSSSSTTYNLAVGGQAAFVSDGNNKWIQQY